MDDAAVSRALRTCSLLDASTCSRASESPFCAFVADSVTTYELPSPAIEPPRTAFAPARKAISRASSVVIRSSGGGPLNPSAWRTRDSGRIFRYGDCSSCTASACFNVPSKTGSPVVFTKSARTTVSFSVSAVEWRERRNNPPPISAAITTNAAIAAIVHDLVFPAETGSPTAEIALADLTALDEPDPCPDETGPAVPAPDDAAGIGGVDPESCATATAPELAATAR